MMGNSDVLRLDKVSKSFGGLQVLADVDLSVREEEIVGLIGPNGAGKSTLFNVITSFYTTDRGDIYLRGERITGLAPHSVNNDVRLLRRGNRVVDLGAAALVLAVSQQDHRLAARLMVHLPVGGHIDRIVEQGSLGIADGRDGSPAQAGNASRAVAPGGVDLGPVQGPRQQPRVSCNPATGPRSRQRKAQRPRPWA